MPRVVDHQVRRNQIADAVGAIAVERGLGEVSFREVAARAGMSVALVQHYVGSKAGMLTTTLEVHSARLGTDILDRLGTIDSPDAATRLRTIASSFIPTDAHSRAAMQLYHAFAAAALSDPELRGTASFRNARGLETALAGELAGVRDAIGATFDPATEATTIVSLVLGLSLGVLLEQMTSQAALDALDAHLARLTEPPT